MKRHRDPSPLKSGLYDGASPRIPREWLLPERLEVALASGGERQSCPVSEDAAARWSAFFGKRSATPPVEDLSQAIRELHHPTPADLCERLEGAFCVPMLDALSAVYTWGRAWHRYDADVEQDLAGRERMEKVAIRHFNPNRQRQAMEATKAAAGAELRGPLLRKADKTLTGLSELSGAIHAGPGEDGYLVHCAAGLRANQSSLLFLRGWVQAYGHDAEGEIRQLAPGRVAAVEPGQRAGGFDSSAFRQAMAWCVAVAIRPKTGAGERVTAARVPWHERPPFIAEDAWRVPCCLWSDAALARLGNLRMKDPGRAAADRVRALELDRPDFYVVGLSPGGMVVNLPKPVKRKTAPLPVDRKSAQKIRTGSSFGR